MKNGTVRTDKTEIASKFSHRSAGAEVFNFDFVKDTRGQSDQAMAKGQSAETKSAARNPESLRQSMVQQINMTAFREARKLADVTEAGPDRQQAMESIENWRCEAQARLEKVADSDLSSAKTVYGTGDPAEESEMSAARSKRNFPKKGMKG